MTVWYCCTQTEKDTTIQRRAVDVLYEVCDKQNVTEIVAELLKFLDRADYAIREELVCTVILIVFVIHPVFCLLVKYVQVVF